MRQCWCTKFSFRALSFSFGAILICATAVAAEEMAKHPQNCRPSFVSGKTRYVKAPETNPVALNAPLGAEEGLAVAEFDRKISLRPRTVETSLSVRRPVEFPELVEVMQRWNPIFKGKVDKLLTKERNQPTSVHRIRKELDNIIFARLNVAYYQMAERISAREKTLAQDKDFKREYLQLTKIINKLNDIVLLENKNEERQLNLVFYNVQDIATLVKRYHEAWGDILERVKSKMATNSAVMGEIFSRNMYREEIQMEFYNTLMVKFHRMFMEKLASVINASDFFVAKTYTASFSPYGEILGVKIRPRSRLRNFKASDPIEWKTLLRVIQQIEDIYPGTEVVFAHEQQFFQIAMAEKFRPITNHYFARIHNREYNAPIFDVPFNVFDRKEDATLTVNRLQKDFWSLKRYQDLAQGGLDRGQIVSGTGGPSLLRQQDIRYDNSDHRYRFVIDELWSFAAFAQNIALNASDIKVPASQEKLAALQRKNQNRLSLWPQVVHDYLAKLQEILHGLDPHNLPIRLFATGKNSGEVQVIIEASHRIIRQIDSSLKVPARSFAFILNLPAPALAIEKIKLPPRENINRPYDGPLTKECLTQLMPQITQRIATIMAEIERDFGIKPKAQGGSANAKL